MKKSLRFSFCIMFLGIAAFACKTGTAYAACSSPAGVAGSVAFASTGSYSAMVACDGSDWVPWAGWTISGYPAPQYSSSGGSGSAAGADTEIQFNNAGSFGADSKLVWDNTSKRLTVGGAAGGWGNLQITDTAPTLTFYDSDAPAASGGGLQGSGLVFRDTIGQVAGRLGYLNTTYLILENDVQGGNLRLAAKGGVNSDIVFYASSGSNEMMRITGDGFVGIGKSAPGVALDVVGDINFTGVLMDVSDIRVKENIRPLRDPLKNLALVHGFSYTLKNDPKGNVEYGVSAQDVQKAFPELVSTFDHENGTLGVNYQGLIPPMIEAINQQQKQIETLNKRIQDLERQIAKDKDIYEQ